MSLELDWSLAHQRLVALGESFDHWGDPGTTVAHDVCHLIVAANGRLPWRPKGSDAEIRRAEFNAVFLESIYHHTHISIVQRRDFEEVLVLALEHARDFVLRHYAPFPVSFDDARGDFLEAIAPELVARHLPTYLEAWDANETTRRFPFPRVRLRFAARSAPAWEAPRQRDLEELLVLARRRLS